MSKVSIIIPAYNIGNYIQRCINSCIKQTFNDIQIIIVNDGSTDDTLSKINEFSDSRIIVINQENKGSMEARKAGINASNGKYLYFIDGDDYMEENTIKVLYEKAIEDDYDIICHNFFINDTSDKTNNWKTLDCRYRKDDRLLELLFDDKITHNMWSKLIKKDFIKKNNINMPSNFSFGEDLAFIYTLAMYNPKFAIIDEYLYHYCRRENSLDSNINEKTYEINLAMKFVKKQLVNTNLYERYREQFEYMCFIQSYYMRKNYIFKNRDKISKDLFKGWKSLKININTKNNKFYKELYEKDSKKALIVEAICKKSYYLGHLYYKFK